MARLSAAVRRTEFIRAAVQVISAHGIEGATTRRIAEEAEAPLASLHYCFSSKELLFAAVCEEMTRVLDDEVFTPRLHQVGIAGATDALLRRIMTWYQDESVFTAAVVELMLWARRQKGEVGRAPYDSAYSTLRQVLSEHADRDGLDADAVARIATMIISISDGFALRWIAYDGAPDFPADVELATRTLSRFVATELAAVTRDK